MGTPRSAVGGKRNDNCEKIDWCGKEFQIPSIYFCNKGLVIDVCVKIPSEHIDIFIKKWNLDADSSGTNFTNSEQLEMEAENPLSLKYNMELELNRKIVPHSAGCALCWSPYLTEQNCIEALNTLDHYKLDPSYGWIVWRSSFSWITKRKPKISSIIISLSQDSIAIAGKPFNVTGPNQYIDFVHPLTNTRHTLFVQEYKKQQIPKEHFDDSAYEYPTNITTMSYAISPDLPEGSFQIRDCSDGDRPRKKLIVPTEPQTTSDCAAIGIIGGSNGPTVITFGTEEQGKLRVACSSLTYEPINVEAWQIFFYTKEFEDIKVVLI